MSPSADINQLSIRRSELHHSGDVAGAIRLQVQILRLLEERGGSVRDIANAHNYLSVLYAKNGGFALGEVHAQCALALHEAGSTLKDHDALACYSMTLARILYLLGRQIEAIPHAEIALTEWAMVHSPTSGFLNTRQEELIAFRAGTWANVFSI
jgi:hypothetical protein